MSLASGEAVNAHERVYRRAVLPGALPGGERLPALWFLPDALGYEEWAADTF